MPPGNRARKRAIVEAAVQSNPMTPEERGNRAMALMCATVCWRGESTDSEGLLGVADEFLQYIEGDDSKMPRSDPLTRGRLPKP